MKDTAMRQAPESTISNAQARTELANAQTNTDPVGTLPRESTALANAQTGPIPVHDRPQERAALASAQKDTMPAFDRPQEDIALASAQDTMRTDASDNNVCSNAQDIMMDVDHHRSAQVDSETGANSTDSDDWAMVDRKSLLSSVSHNTLSH